MNYSRYDQDRPQPRRTINPVWRGIGCILFVITPITALAVGNVIIASGFLQRYIYIPPEMLRPLTIPGLNFTITGFVASLSVAALITFVLFTLYFTLYAALYRMFGPSKYGPMDAPPQKARGRSRKSR